MDYTQFPMKQMSKPKRVRSAFTTEQVAYLEQQYKKFPYIGTEYRKEVASTLNIQDRAVKIWFQNRRMREKKELKEDSVKIDKNEEHVSLNSPHTVSTNDQLSLQVSPMTVGVPIEVNVKDEKGNKPKIKLNNETNPTLDNFNNESYHPSVITNKNALNFKNIAYIPMETCKKTKLPKVIENQKRKIQHNLQRMNQCPKTIDKSSNRYYQYYPIMRAVYAHPVASPGVIWKPMNVLPLVSSGSLHQSNVNSVQGISCNAQKKKCSCNCHSSHTPQFYSPGVNINNSPYHQYVISMPYQNHSSRV